MCVCVPDLLYTHTLILKGQEETRSGTQTFPEVSNVMAWQTPDHQYWSIQLYFPSRLFVWRWSVWICLWQWRSAGKGVHQRWIADLGRYTPTFSSHWASDTLLIPSVRIYRSDCHYSKSHYSPALFHHDNTLQHAPLHPIRPAKTQNTAHQGGGQRKGILRLRTQTVFCEEA